MSREMRPAPGVVLVCLALALCCAAWPARADLSLTWHTIDAGGLTLGAGGTYSLGGTAGQPDAGVALGGHYHLGGGFWRGGQGFSGVGECPGPEQELPVPVAFRVLTDDPNPFTTQTSIRLDLPEGRPVDACIFDHTGRLVNRIYEGWLPPGRHNLVWTGNSASGRQVPTGIYLLQMRVGDHTTRKRLVFFK